MALHRKVTEPGIYFVTFANHAWLPLIQLTDSYDLVYNWFNILKERGHIITGYVIMPNHLHILLYYAGGDQSLNTVVGNGKRFMAYDIVTRLERSGNSEMIDKLRKDVKVKDKSRRKIHEVWKNAFDVKECRTEKFIIVTCRSLPHPPFSPCLPCAGKRAGRHWALGMGCFNFLSSYCTCFR